MTDQNDSSLYIPEDIISHYNLGFEADRLKSGRGQLEFVRTQEIIRRYAPSPPGVILDVGGGAGIHALPLAQFGYEVHLIDVVPLHIEQALQASLNQPDYPLASAAVGDARKLETADNSVDVLLLLGPLYHLTQHPDRLEALEEAYRVLKPGGLVFAAAISRFASLMDGMLNDFLDDPDFVKIVEDDLESGQHRNPTENPNYFATAFFHTPDELRAEIEKAGFQHECLLGIEGPGWLIAEFDEYWQDVERRERMLGFMRSVEKEPSLLGASAHMMAIGRKG